MVDRMTTRCLITYEFSYIYIFIYIYIYIITTVKINLDKSNFINKDKIEDIAQ